MKVMAIDPGRTTGVCICRCIGKDNSFTLLPIEHKQIHLISSQETNYSISLDRLLVTYKPDLVLIEAVVPTGHLSKDKVDQIRAHDRALIVAAFRGKQVKEVQPQAVKRVKDVPKEIVGAHARDAYRVIITHFRSIGQYETDTETKEGQKGKSHTANI